MSGNNARLLFEAENSVFLQAYEQIIENLKGLNDNSFNKNMEQETEWMLRVFQHNVENVKQIRKGHIVPAVYNAILNKKEVCGQIEARKNLKLANVLGWIVELYYSASLMTGDIMENRQYRIGSKGSTLSWHKMNNVGMNAVNDSFILQMATHNLLKIYFDQSPIFMNLANLCRETIQKRICGNILKKRVDHNENDVSCYTMQRYRQVTNWSMSYHSFYLPIAFAWTLAENEDTDEVRKALRRLAFELGYYHQIRSDYEEIFAEGANADKMGKWSWFYVKSVEILSASDKADELAKLHKFMKNGDIESLRAFYKSLKVHEMYLNERENCQNTILEQIKNLPQLVVDNLDVRVFVKIVQTL